MRKITSISVTLLFLLAASTVPAQEQEEAQGEMPNTLNEDHVPSMSAALTKTAPTVLSVFSPVVSNASSSVVTVLVDGEPVALGAIVESDGLLLTKASQLHGEKITCRLHDKRRFEAVVLARDDEQDLALLKVGATNLTPVCWRQGKPPAPGHWVITPGPSQPPVSVGVVSATERSWRMRRRDTPRGFLGVQLEPGESNTVRVVRVVRGLAADESGVEAGDTIASIDGEEIASVDQLIRKVGGTAPDSTVSVGLLRSGEALSVDAKLGSMPVHTPELRWGGGPFSKRRYEFPNVLPHDTVLQPTQCGGPLLDVDGRVVGINIARALRVASYALVASDVRRVLGELKSRAPADVEVSSVPVRDEPPSGDPDIDETLAEDTDAELVRQWIKAVQARDGDALGDATDKFIARFPKRGASFLVRAAETFLAHLHDHERGYKLAWQLADEGLDADAQLLNELSWFIFTDKRVKKRDIDCGMELARLAVKRSQNRNAAILDTLARGHVEQGNLEQAIKVQKRALKRARGASRAVIKETLERYVQAQQAL